MPEDNQINNNTSISLTEEMFNLQMYVSTIKNTLREISSYNIIEHKSYSYHLDTKNIVLDSLRK